MRKKFLTVILTMIATIACAIGLFACGEAYNNNDNKDIGGDIAISATGNEAKIGSTEYATLSAAFTAASTATSASTITLLRDVECESAFSFGSYKTITLDLNGYAITAVGPLANDEAIFNMSYCTFTLQDSAPTRPHTITVDGKSVTINGGIITGGKRGFKLGYDGKLTMNGGTICGNSSTDTYAAGVYVTGGAFTMNKGAIMYNTNNDGQYGGGGGVGVTDSTFKMAGGTISNNSVASGNGAGVWINGQSGFLNLEGDAIVVDNISGSSASNVYLNNTYNKIYFTGAMIDGAKIGISNNYTFTSNYKSTNSGADPRKYFFADNTTKAVGLNSSDEVEVVNAVAAVTTGGVTTNYPDINSAWTDANGKTATVTLLTNATPTAQIFLHVNNSSSNITFDLDGHTLILGTNIRIFVSNGILTLKDTAGGGKITSGLTLNGGAVIVSGGTFNFNGGAITGNRAQYGGGVYISGGTVNMDGGEISENGTLESGYAVNSGGGVYIQDGEFNLISGKITGNVASGGDVAGGGGVYLNSGTFNMSGGEISDNTASAAHGGGVFVFGGVFKMTGGIITQNTAKVSGGGVYVSSDGSSVDASGRFEVSGTPKIKDNIVTDGGNVGKNVYLTKNHSVKSINVVGELKTGAEIYVMPDSYVRVFTSGYGDYNSAEPSNYFKNEAHSSYGSDYKVLKTVSGGKLEAEIANVNATNKTVEVTTSLMTLQLTSIYEAWNYGLNNSPATVKLLADITLDGSILAKLTHGKNITLDLNGHTLDLAKKGHLSIEGNNANSTDVTILTLKDSGTGGTLKNGQAANGGGVYVLYGTFTMDGGAITDCVANSSLGASFGGDGGVFVYTGGKFIMNDGAVTGNSTTAVGSTGSYGGGGVFIDGGTFTMADGEISDNTAGSHGGGVFINTNGNFTMNGGTISGNTSGSTAVKYGGGVFARGATFTLTDGKITGNKVGNSGASVGGGVYVEGGCKFNIGGTAFISGNTLSDGTTPSNVRFPKNNDRINIISALVDGASIGITIHDTIAATGTFTKGYKTYNGSDKPDKYFFDTHGYKVLLDADGEVKIALAVASVAFKDGDEAYYDNIADAWTSATALAAQNKEDVTIKLLADMDESDRTFELKDGGTVAFDINGHTYNIVSSMTFAYEKFVITKGELIIQDSSEEQTGALTTSGVTVALRNSNSTFTLKSGTISGTGSAVIAENGSVVNIKGGILKGCGDSPNDAGIVLQSANLKVSGGKITGNYGAAIRCQDHMYSGVSTIDLSGGEISGNTGAAFALDDSYDTKINVSGSPIIKNNSSNLTKKATVTAPLEDGAEIHYSGANGVITSGYSQNNGNDDPEDYFVADGDNRFVYLNSGEAVVGLAVMSVVTAAGETKYTKTYDAWNAAKAAAKTAGVNEEVKIKLQKNLSESDKVFELTDGGAITFDLNGKEYALSHNSSSFNTLFKITKGKIIFKDSSVEKTGYITTTGGLVYLGNSNCECEIEGGKLRGTQFAINVRNGATLTMSGGMITQSGGGGSGAIILNSATFNMTDGELFDNMTCIVCEADSTVNLSGGKIINNNREGVAKINGGDLTINVSGNPVVKDNSINITKKVSVIAPLTAGAEIYIDIEGVVTSGYYTNNGSSDPSVYFKSGLGKLVYLNGDGEVKMDDGVAKVTATGVSQNFGTLEAAVAFVNSETKATANPMTLTLLAPIEISSTLMFKATSGAKIYLTFDLNGYVLKMTGTGRVMSIDNAPQFLITDSRSANAANSADGTTFEYNGKNYTGGVITGGNVSGSGSTENRAGGAILIINNNSVFTLGKGSIIGNSATGNGGAIAGITGGNIFINGGLIAHNSAGGLGGGIYWDSASETVTMSGGKIEYNTASNGSAIYVGRNNRNDILKISGGEITHNTGGYAVATQGHKNNNYNTQITLSGNPVIRDNSTGNIGLIALTTSASNPAFITVGKLNTGADIHVYSETYDSTTGANNVLTIGYSANNADVNGIISPARYFTYDAPNKIVYLISGEVAVGEPLVQVTVGDGEPKIYGSISEAFAEANAATTSETVTAAIKPLANVTTSTTLTVGAGKYIALDLNGKNVTMTGGANVITVNGNFSLYGNGNISGGKNGGVVVNSGGKFDMLAGTITGNVGGGVVVNNGGNFYISGAPVISGNTTSGTDTTAKNVYLASGAVITVNGALTSDADIGVTLEVDGVFTSGYADNNNVSGVAIAPKTYFKSDKASYLLMMYDKEAYLGELTATVTDKDGTVTEYPSFEMAWNAALALGTTEDDMATVTLMKDIDISASANVPSGKFIKLDLNGHVLKMTGAGSVITVSGQLTIDDSNTDNLSNEIISKADGSTLTISGGVITGGTASGISLAQNSGAVVNLEHGAIAGNTAANGGGVSILDGCTFNMNGGKVIGNKATNSGGGVYSTHGTFNLNDGEVEGNSAVKNAGGVSATNSTVFNMTGGKIIDNTVPTEQPERSGGGVYINGITTITGGEISGNTANWCGGGIFLEGGFLYLYGGTIENNTATYGGGIYYFGGELHVKGNPVVSGNNATSSKTNNAGNNISVVVWGRRIHIDGVMGESASLGITLCGDSGTGNGTGLFTSGYASNNTVADNVADPSDYFFSDGGYSVILNGTEAGIFTVFTVNFYDEDGELLDGPKKVVKDEKVTFSGTLPTKDNTAEFAYTFGWYERVGATDTLYNIDTTPVTRNLELYGLFVAKTREYVVTVNEVNETGRLNGATQRTVEYGTKLTVDGYSLKVEKTGKTYSAFTANITNLYDFVGWEIDGELRADGYEYTVTGDVTVKLVVRIKVNLVWTYDNKNVNTTVYNGECDKGYVKVVFTDVNGTAIAGMEYDGFSDEINMAASNGKTDLQDVGTYTFSVKDLEEFEKYVFLNDSSVFEFEITPYLIDLSNDDYYHWTLAGYDSALRNGKVYVYEVDGEMLYYFEERSDLGTPVEVKEVVRSIVRYRGEGKTHTININDDEMAPLFADETKDRSSVVYSGVRSATELGRYNAVATLTLNDKLNYKYVCGTIDPKREMSIDLSDNGTTAVIKKAWYVATISNALLLPDRSDEYSIEDFTYGDNSFVVPIPVLEHGSLTDGNAQFTLTKIENGNRIVIGTFVYSKLGEYVNKSMPAGDYILDINVDSVPDEGGISHEAFENSYNFTVEKADITPYITKDNAKGNSYEYEYTGGLQLHNSEDLKVALPYAASADRIGVWQNAEYDKYYAAVIGYSMSRWSNPSYRTLEQLNSQITVAQKPINVGEYKVYYRITANNFTTYGGDISKGENAEYFYTVSIAKVDYDTDDWGFEKDRYEFIYDSESHSVVVKNIPEGVKVTYTVTDKDGNVVPTDSVIDAGEYTVTATFVGDDNHKPIPADLTCSTVLEIIAQDFELKNVIFKDKTVVYNGSAFGVDEITGLPDGITVVYSENSFINVGRYQVTATISANANYNLIGDTELSAYLYILATDLTVYVGETEEVLVTVHSSDGFAYGTELEAEIIDDYTSTQITDDILSATRIKLVNGGETVQPSGDVTVRVLIPEGVGEKSYRIVLVNGDAATDLEYTVDGNYAVVTTNACGEFVFVDNTEIPVIPVNPEQSNKDGGKSFWKSYWWLWLILLLLLILIIILIIIFKRRKDDKEDETAAAVAPLAVPTVAPVQQVEEDVTAQGEEDPTQEETDVPEETAVPEKEPELTSAPDDEALNQAAEEEARKIAEAEAKKKERAEKAKATRAANAAKAKAEREAAETAAKAAAIAAAEEEARKQAEAEEKKKERAAKAKAAREARAAKLKEEQEALAAMDEEARAAAEAENARKKAEAEAKKKERAEKAKATRAANAEKAKAEREAAEAAEKAAAEEEARKQAEAEEKKKERAAKAKAAREARAAAMAEERERIAAEEAKKLLADEQAAALIQEIEEPSDRSKQCIINIDMLSRYFENGETVTLKELQKRVPKFDRRATYLKVLARGTLDKKLTVVADSFSLDAVKMIALTGGSAVRKGKK